MKEVSLPSGATLKIQLAPFSQAQELLRAFLEEVRGIEIHGDDEVNAELIKNMVCAGITSKRFNQALAECFKRCMYNDDAMRDLDKVFEDEVRRQDYLVACYEVTLENIAPFVKSLFAKLSPMLEMLKAPAPA